MNAARRKELRRALDLLSEAREIISMCGEEERAAFDNLSLGLQESELGQRLDEAANALEEAAGALEDVESNVDEAIQ
jgi:hypothetical protein